MDAQLKAAATMITVVLCLAAALPSIALVRPAAAEVGRVTAQDEQTYYGYIPHNIWRYENKPGVEGEYWINPETVMDHGVLAIVGAHEGTSVSIYTLPDKKLVKSFTVNKMENMLIGLPNGTFFKVVTSMPASVAVLGGAALEAKPMTQYREFGAKMQYGTYSGASFSSFVPSVDGGYVGKEFVFLDVHSTLLKGERGGVGIPPGLPYAVFALEESTVTVWDENGTQAMAPFQLKVNKHKDFAFIPYKVYRLESTGNVMVQTFVVEKPCFIPAAKGTFVGTVFYAAGSVPESGNVPNPLRFFLLSSIDGAKASIYDLDFARKSVEVTVPAGENVSLRTTDSQFMSVESDRPMLIAYRSQPSEGGIAVAGLAAGQTTGIEVYTGGAYIFAYTDTVVTVDDVRTRLGPDEILPVTEGWHRISTDQNIIIEAAHIEPGQGFNAFGQYLPSAQSIGLRYEGLSLKPVVEQTPWLYYGAAAAVVIIVVLAAWSLRRRKP